MSDNDRAAYIQSQATCALIEALGMMAENMQRQVEGNSPAYGSGNFISLIDHYHISHNDVVSYLRD